MENYDQLMNMGAPLTSAFRALTPSILAKRSIRQMPTDLSRLMPTEPQIQLPGGGLGSLQSYGRSLMGDLYPKDDSRVGQASLLGGL